MGTLLLFRGSVSKGRPCCHAELGNQCKRLGQSGSSVHRVSVCLSRSLFTFKVRDTFMINHSAFRDLCHRRLGQVLINPSCQLGKQLPTLVMSLRRGQPHGGGSGELAVCPVIQMPRAGVAVRVSSLLSSRDGLKATLRGLSS